MKREKRKQIEFRSFTIEEKMDILNSETQKKSGLSIPRERLKATGTLLFTFLPQLANIGGRLVNGELARANAGGREREINKILRQMCQELTLPILYLVGVWRKCKLDHKSKLQSLKSEETSETVN